MQNNGWKNVAIVFPYTLLFSEWPKKEKTSHISLNGANNQKMKLPPQYPPSDTQLKI